MKNKKIIFSLSIFFLASFLFLSGNKIVKAEDYASCYSGCITDGNDGPTCQDGCSYLLNSDGTPTTDSTTNNPDLPTSDNSVGCVNYDYSTSTCLDGAPAAPASIPDTSGSDGLPGTDAYCKTKYGPQAYLADDNTCQQFDPNTEKCTADQDCVLAKGSGYKCDTSSGDCVPSGIAGFAGSQCKTDTDCVQNYGEGFVCNTSGFTNKCVQGPPSAADNAAANKAQLDKTQANAALQNATNRYNQATQALATCGSDCIAAQAAAAQAQKDLLAAQAAADQSNQAYQDAMAAQGVSNSSGNTGGNGGLNMIANGILGPVVDQGQYPGGVTYPGGGYTNNGALPGNYTTSSNYGVAGPKCAANFTEIGGVCFPANTGLANPAGGITQIVSNLFSWLMGLFTTLAVLAFVVSGIQYLAASANEELAKKAKNNASFALMGIIVGLSGFIIIQAISAALTGQGYFF